MLHHVSDGLNFRFRSSIELTFSFLFFRLIRHYVEEDDAASVITSEEGNRSGFPICLFLFVK